MLYYSVTAGGRRMSKKIETKAARRAALGCGAADTDSESDTDIECANNNSATKTTNHPSGIFIYQLLFRACVMRDVACRYQ